MFANLYIYVLANGMGRTRTELFRNSAAKNGAILLDDSKPLPTALDENRPTESYKLRSQSSQSKLSATRIVVVVDENTIQNWDNFEKAMASKKLFASLKSHLGGAGGKEEQEDEEDARVVSSVWMSECLKSKMVVDTKKYEIRPPKKQEKKETAAQATKPVQRRLSNESTTSSVGSKQSKNTAADLSEPESDYMPSESDTSVDSDQEACKFEKMLKNKLASKPVPNPQLAGTLKPDVNTWTCAHSSKEQKVNHNKFITDKLEEMSAIYENTKDKYRALGYQKAIHALKKCAYLVNSREKAASLPGVGKKITDEIFEIIETGELSKLDELRERDDIKAIRMFTNIHGVGPTIAQQFVARGYRTLDDLRSKAKLTRQQQIGLKYYDEFLQRIPRDEAARIEKTVKDAALSIKEGLIVQACGSYRRGKPSCGDIDVLITHPDGHSHKKIFSKLIEMLHKQKFLTDDLVIQDEMKDESQRKYLGVCQLPEPNSLHRRLDIIVVPYDEYACALLYFTGSAHFNRSMRNLARQMGMALSEHSINEQVQRGHNAEKINAGVPIPTATEEDVFKILNLKYRSPEERDF